jgi:hypothetical protein
LPDDNTNEIDVTEQLPNDNNEIDVTEQLLNDNNEEGI